MKKGPVVGIGVAIVALSVIIGIASIPDEVLLESPNLESSENMLIGPLSSETISQLPPLEETVEESVVEEAVEEPTDTVIEEQIDVPVEEPAEEPDEGPAEEPLEEPVEEPLEEPVEEETSEGKVIKVEVEDGVGGGDR